MSWMALLMKALEMRRRKPSCLSYFDGWKAQSELSELMCEKGECRRCC